MNRKRVTIYHIAEELGMSASYVSRALNNHPLVSKKISERVKKKAAELNYKHNSHAANLRRGSSRTIGVIVPHIDQVFFSEAIAGIEETCFANNHGLIICQSHESFQQECKAIDTMVHQNVDCILISISAETQSSSHLETIREHGIELIQFDRCLKKVDSYKVLNNNKEVSIIIVKSLIDQGYKKIAFLGGPEHLSVFKDRKDRYLEAIRKAGLNVPANFIVDNALGKEKAIEIATELLSLQNPPDAFFAVSDHQSLGVLQVADAMGLIVPDELGIFGFANKTFAEIIRPTLSSVDQKSKEMGKRAVDIFLKTLQHGQTKISSAGKETIKSEIIIRESSIRK